MNELHTNSTTNLDDKQTRIEEAELFFNLLYGAVTERKYGYLWTKRADEKITYPFDVSNPAERKAMAVKAIELNDQGADVYYGINLMDTPPTPHERATKETVTLQTAIGTDIDCEGGTHISSEKKKYPPTFDVAKSFLPFDSSILIDSGYGLHGLNLYATPLAITADLREQVNARNKNFINAIRSRAGDYSKAVDGVGDLPRVLRVPGTFNYKLGRDNAPLCHIVEVNDVRFTPESIDSKLDDLKSLRPKERPTPVRKLDRFEELGNDYDLFRAQLMLEAINPIDLSDTDWLAVQSAAKNIGVPYPIVDAFNRTEPDRYNETENLNRWNSLADPAFDIETLHGIAKQFGYQEGDARRQWYQLHPELRNKKSHARRADSKPVDLTQSDDDSQATADDDMEAYIHGFATDLGNAQRLERFCGKSIRWLTDAERWLIWQKSGVWKLQSEKNSCLTPFAKQLADKLAKHAGRLKKLKDDKSLERAQSFFKLSVAFQKAKFVNPAIFMLKGFDSILITREDLDRHKNLLNCLNGVVDLQTEKLYPHRAPDLITQQTRAAFRPNYRNSVVDDFLTSILPDEETRAALLRWLGYCLTGEISEQCAHFWTGNGSNGKSTLLEFLLYLLADYATKLPVKAVVETREAEANATTTHLNCLAGKRLAVVNEFKPNHRLDVQQFKDLTGDKFLDIRRLHHERETIEMLAKLVLNGNELPRLSNSDSYALQRRIRALRFEQTFSLERGNLDPALPKKLATPDACSAMLSLLVPQAAAWYRDSEATGTGLLEATAMKAAKTEYLSENDFIEEFFCESCTFANATAEIPIKDFEERLKAAYPYETMESRIRKKDLRAQIQAKAQSHGATVAIGRGRAKVLKGVGWLLTAEFAGSHVDPRDIP